MKIFGFATSPDGQTLDVTMYGVLYGDWFKGSEEDDFLRAINGFHGSQINVHINSEGGDMFAGIAIRNVLAGHKASITCIVEGLAASAASIVATAGKCVMGVGAMLMVHNPWAIVIGDATELRAVAEMLDKAIVSLVAIYEAKTKKSAAELRKLLAAETWMTAEEAVAAGFADEITDDAPILVEDRADAVLLNRVSFPRNMVPARIRAMARSPQQEPPMPTQATPTPAAPVAPTREAIAAQAPEVLAALLAEGHAAGVLAERARIQEIDKLRLPASQAAVAQAAKYGPTPLTADQVLRAAWDAADQAGGDLLAARRSESPQVAALPPQAAGNATTEERAIQSIVDGGNARRGGKVR